jgi:hypothetical protein
VKRVVALCAVLACARIATADPEADADRAFRDASVRATLDAPAAIEQFEAIGTARPITRWTDDAWSEVARLAERAGDFARARRALGEVLATSRDDKTLQRARAALARLNADTSGGTWDAVKRDHARLLGDVYDGGDPSAALTALETLARTNPGYPRRVDLALAIARGWELEGHGDRALGWYRTAMEIATVELQRAGLARARAQIREGELDGARATLDTLAARTDADRFPLADVRASLEARETRVRIRWMMWIVLALVTIVATVAFRRATGTWRGAARRITKPPIEALFLLPVAAVLVVISQTGNPLVGNSVTAIVIGGFAITWLNGSLLEAWRSRTWQHVLGHVAAALVATGALVYLATEHHIDLIAETWEHGPQR